MPGEYNSQAGQTKCMQCDKNAYSKLGSTNCLLSPCKAGDYKDSSSGSCLACPQGWNSKTLDAQKCEKQCVLNNESVTCGAGTIQQETQCIVVKNSESNEDTGSYEIIPILIIGVILLAVGYYQYRKKSKPKHPTTSPSAVVPKTTMQTVVPGKVADGGETEEYSSVQVKELQVLQEAQRIFQLQEQEANQTHKNSAVARSNTKAQLRGAIQFSNTEAHVKKRLALRKRAKQMGVLQKCAAFANISEASRDHIVDGMTYEKIAHGTVLCMQGDPADCMYLLMSGACKVMVNMQDVGTLKTLDFFGEAALFATGDDEDPSRFRIASVIAVDDLEVLVLKDHELARLLAFGDLDDSTVAALRQVAQERKRANLGEDVKQEAASNDKSSKETNSSAPPPPPPPPPPPKKGFTSQQKILIDGKMKSSKRLQEKFTTVIDGSVKVAEKTKTQEEAHRIRKHSEMHRSTTINKIKQKEEKANARVQKRLELRKRAKQMGALKKCDAFANVSETSRDNIVDGMTYEKVLHGTVLCMQGDPAKCMYLLMSGSCTVMVNMQEVGQLWPLDVFGEAALFASGDAENPSRFRTATVIAVDDLEILGKFFD